MHSISLKQNLIYAELDHKKSSSVPLPPPRPHNERVNYEEVIPGAVGTPLLKDSRHKAGIYIHMHEIDHYFATVMLMTNMRECT